MRLENIIELHCSHYDELIVAYSGGVDSHVLLHALALWCLKNSQKTVRAVHINHGLSPFSMEWEQHCEQVCASLNISFNSHSLNLKDQILTGESIEAVAREARYKVLSQYLNLAERNIKSFDDDQIPPSRCLLTAHHQDDQAETLLLQLFRGAGPKGLAAMPEVQTLAAGHLCRPFLHISRSQLLDYAKFHDLQWIEDESNDNTQFFRNYLRHDIIPKLKTKWPALTKNLVRSARLCAQSQILLNELAEHDWTSGCGAKAGQLINYQALSALSKARQCNVLRYWITKNGYRAPGERRLLTFLTNLDKAGEDRAPELTWDHITIRRYKQQLYLLKTADLIPNSIRESLMWDLGLPLTLPYNLGRLSATLCSQGGLNPDLKHQKMRVCFRACGERFRPEGANSHKSLKKLMQEWFIPPWQRSRIPLLYYNNELVSVVGYCISEDYAVSQKPGLLVEWHAA